MKKIEIMKKFKSQKRTRNDTQLQTQREFNCDDIDLVKLNCVSKQDGRYKGPGKLVEKRHDIH